MKTLLKLAFLLLPICLFAQEDEVFDRLHSKSLEQSLYLSFDGTNFFYKSELSNEEKGFLKLTNGQLRNFQIGNDDENTLQIFIEFYNPLTHKVTSTATESDDENFKALSAFMENLSSNVGDFAEVTNVNQESVFGTKALNAMKVKMPKRKDIIDEINGKLNSMYQKSPFLNDWISMFKTGVASNPGILVNKLYSQKVSEVVETINGMQSVEDFLYRKFDGSDKNVIELIKANTEELRNVSVNDLTAFKQKVKVSKELYVDLSKALQKVKTNLDKIKTLLNSDEVIIMSFFNTSQSHKDNFHNVHNGKIVYVEAIVGKELEAHETAINKLKELNEKLSKYCEAYENDKYPEGFKLLEEDAFGVQYEKKRTYEVVGVQLNASGDEVADKKVTNSFVVRKSQGRLAVFTSLGMFYTPFEYKNYGLSEGLVAETQGDPVYIRPAFYLNFLYRLRQGDIFYPMFQVGITQGIKTPMFPIGVGFTIRDRFSVTAGPLLAFQRELDKLEIGAMADDATLQDDLESRIKASFYISINFRL